MGTDAKQESTAPSLEELAAAIEELRARLVWVRDYL